MAGHDAARLKAQFAERPEYAASDSEYFEQLLDQVYESRTELDKEIEQFGDIPADQLDEMNSLCPEN
jgi:transcription termination factor NusB